MTRIACPRCGHVDTFTKGYLPETCVCRVCQSQLDWREIPGMGPECRPLEAPAGADEQSAPSGPSAAPSGPSAGPGTEE